MLRRPSEAGVRVGNGLRARVPTQAALKPLGVLSIPVLDESRNLRGRRAGGGAPERHTTRVFRNATVTVFAGAGKAVVAVALGVVIAGMVLLAIGIRGASQGSPHQSQAEALSDFVGSFHHPVYWLGDGSQTDPPAEGIPRWTLYSGTPDSWRGILQPIVFPGGRDAVLTVTCAQSMSGCSPVLIKHNYTPLTAPFRRGAVIVRLFAPRDASVALYPGMRAEALASLEVAPIERQLTPGNCNPVGAVISIWFSCGSFVFVDEAAEAVAAFESAPVVRFHRELRSRLVGHTGLRWPGSSH